MSHTALSVRATHTCSCPTAARSRRSSSSSVVSAVKSSSTSSVSVATEATDFCPNAPIDRASPMPIRVDFFSDARGSAALGAA